jgi:uncharacterized cupin superfamily protein
VQPSVHRVAIANASLGPWPIPAEQIRAGRPEARGMVLTRSPECVLASGVWECTPGTFVWSYGWDETSCIVAGTATLTAADGGSTFLRAGDICAIHRASVVTWEIHETIRKGFSLFAPEGLTL